jgi:hypothetical protein
MAFQGSLKELPLPDIIQLVSVSGKTGVFRLKNGTDSGEIYLQRGQIAHAQVGDLSGEEAVYELAIWRQGDFVFTPGTEPPISSITRSNTNLLMEAARRIDEWQVLSKRIPSTRLVPVFTDQGVNTSVSLTAQEWAVICKVDERRSIEEISKGMGLGPFEVCKLLYGLITSGLVALREHQSQAITDKLRSMAIPELGALTERIHRLAHQLMTLHERSADLEMPLRMSRAELDSGRGVDAVLDLIRAQEKVVSGALGPNQAKSFLERVNQLVAG